MAAGLSRALPGCSYVVMLCRLCRVGEKAAQKCKVPFGQGFVNGAISRQVRWISSVIPDYRGSHGGRFIRVAPWGPRRDKSDPIKTVAELELTDADVLPGRSKSPKDSSEVNADHFSHVTRILKQYNFDMKEAQQNPSLFSLKWQEVEDRLEAYKELGWETVTADMIAFHTILFTKRTAKQVIGSDSYSVTRNVLQSLLDELGISEDVQQGSLSAVTETTAAYLTLYDCRTLALREYLRQIYPDPADVQTALKTLLKPNGPYRPVKSWQRQFRYLLDEFKIPPKRVLKYPNLMRKSERHYADLLKNHLKFYDIDVRLVSATFPQITLGTPERYTRLEAVLEKYGITQFQLSRQLLISSISAETLEKRLKLLKADPQLWKFHESPDFLPLVIRYNDVMRRLAFLREMKATEFGLSLLICSRPQFHNALKRGSFAGPDTVVKPQHLIPAAEWLGMSVTEVRQRLRSQVNVKYFASDTKELEAVLQVLSENQISKEQVINCLSILLYPGHLVAKFMNDVLMNAEISMRKNQANFLHYLLYQIEKQSNFAGPSVWATKDMMLDEVDEHELESSLSLTNVRSILNENLSAHLGLNPRKEDSAFADKKPPDWFD